MELGGGTGSSPVLPTIFWVYIILNPAGRFFVGHTDNLAKRLEFHNTGQSHFTARKGPWTLVHSEEYATQSVAMKRESEIKRLKSAIKIRELIEEGEI